MKLVTLPLALIALTVFGADAFASVFATVTLGSKPSAQARSKKLVDGVPYAVSAPWSPAREGASLKIPLSGIQAESLYVLGGGNSYDECNPAWGGGDSFDCIFLGDRGGSLRIKYKSGKVDEIPFVFGYTLWWRGPLLFAHEPLGSDPGADALLNKALCVVNGNEVWKKGHQNKPYYLRINLRAEPIVSLTLVDNERKRGHPLIEALTFAGVRKQAEGAPNNLTIVKRDTPLPTVADRYAIQSSDPFPAKRRNALAAFSRLVTTYPKDICARTVKRTKPEVTPDEFPGPKVTFLGPVIARILTNVYYENANQILGRIDDKTGMVHESGKGADNYGMAFGLYAPGLQPFYDSSYTRIRSLTLLSNMGFDTKVNKALGFYDKWLLYFPDSYPKIQLGGKPVPGHATVVANKPHLYFDVLSKHGWPTRYKTRDFGNPENDGHGMLMLSHWRAWLKQGRSKAWVDNRWRALNEAAEYIPWCLANPDLSFSEHGLLYSESEGGLGFVSMFCNYNCYLGLLAYADMAEATGRKDKADRWRGVAEQLMKAMDAYFPTTIKPWGDVWDPKKTADWQYHHATLAPAIIGMDYYGYDVMKRLPKDWIRRTENTYRMQLTRNQPRYCAPAGMGYGQCYITEAALLLDQMNDAEHMVDWMTRFCFAPRQKHPYRVPEGATIAGDYSKWRRWGDLGNLYQLGEVIYTIQLMLGIDDINPAHFVLMPRIPQSWSGANVSRWPIRTLSQGKSTTVFLNYELKRTDNAVAIAINLDKPIDAGKIRVGPFSSDSVNLRATSNGAIVPCNTEESGDSQWVWLRIGGPDLAYHFRVASSS